MTPHVIHADSRDALRDPDGRERSHPNAFGWKAPRTSSKATARKAASARIAKIPFALSHWIARAYAPANMEPTK